MAYPSPKITFSAQVVLPTSSVLGPKNNERTLGDGTMPDHYQTSADRGNAELANRNATLSTWTPDLMLKNRILTNGSTFVEYGQKAIYLRDHYAVGYAPDDQAVLVVVSVE